MAAMFANPANATTGDAQQFVRNEVIDASAPPEKRPLHRELPPATEFPLDALGPLKEPALAIRNMTQAPLAICAQSVLAAVTIAAQAQRDIQLPAGGRKPLTGLFVSIAESGERKTTVDRLATKAIAQVEEQWRLEWNKAQADYINANEAYETIRAATKRKNKGDRDALQSALANIGPPPTPPPHPILIVSDPTPEALILHLAIGRPMAGIMTDEGGHLLGGAAFNDESRTRTAALLNSLWDGAPIKRIRVGTGATILPGRRCSMHIMVQPVIADMLFGDDISEGIGLLARVLLAAPDSTAGTRFFKENNPADEAALCSYDARLSALLLKPYVTKPDMLNVLDPPAMQLHPDARAAWIAFSDECERKAGPRGELITIKAFAAKLAEHAARLAAVLTVYDNPDATEVSLVTMQSGIELARYYANEMLRLHGGASVAPVLRMARQLLTWWQSQEQKSIYLSLIYQYGPSALRSAKPARIAVEVLEEHGWIDRLPARTLIDGIPRQEAWRLLP
jgi:hypothetical protein